MIATALFMLLLFGLPMLIAGELDLKNDPFILKVLIIAILYIVSIGLVATLPGKSARRRAFSWCISIIFHACLLIYLGVFNEWGGTIFVIGIVETVILAFSILGLGLLVYGQRQSTIA